MDENDHELPIPIWLDPELYGRGIVSIDEMHTPHKKYPLMRYTPLTKRKKHWNFSNPSNMGLWLKTNLTLTEPSPSLLCEFATSRFANCHPIIGSFNVSGQHQQETPVFSSLFASLGSGGTFVEVVKKLYAEGGVPRFYRGLAPGLIQVRQWLSSYEAAAMFSFLKSKQCVASSNYGMQGTEILFGYPTLPDPVPVIKVVQAPVSRFGDTAANDGALAALEHTSLPTAVGDFRCCNQWMVLPRFLGRLIIMTYYDI